MAALVGGSKNWERYLQELLHLPGEETHTSCVAL